MALNETEGNYPMLNDCYLIWTVIKGTLVYHQENISKRWACLITLELSQTLSVMCLPSLQKKIINGTFFFVHFISDTPTTEAISFCKWQLVAIGLGSLQSSLVSSCLS